MAIHVFVKAIGTRGVCAWKRRLPSLRGYTDYRYTDEQCNAPFSGGRQAPRQMTATRRPANQNPDRHLPLTPLTHAVLLALLDEARHGYGIIKEVGRLTAGAIRPRTGTLYSALQRMHDDGLIEEVDGAPGSDDDPRRRYYALSSLGRRVARAEARRLARTLQVAADKALLPPTDLGHLLAEGDA